MFFQKFSHKFCIVWISRWSIRILQTKWLIVRDLWIFLMKFSQNIFILRLFHLKFGSTLSFLFGESFVIWWHTWHTLLNTLWYIQTHTHNHFNRFFIGFFWCSFLFSCCDMFKFTNLFWNVIFLNSIYSHYSPSSCSIFNIQYSIFNIQFSIFLVL